MSINNFIFDFGGVLVDWEPLQAVQTLYPQADAHALTKSLFTDGDWDALDQGIISRDATIAKLSQKNRLSQNEILKILNLLEKNVTVKPMMMGLLKELKQKGCGIYLLSNMSEHDYLLRQKRFAMFSLFDGHIISALLKISKPNPQIYTALLQKYNLKPDTCLFIDDRINNVEAARTVGIESFLFETEDDCVAYLITKY